MIKKVVYLLITLLIIVLLEPNTTQAAIQPNASDCAYWENYSNQKPEYEIAIKELEDELIALNDKFKDIAKQPISTSFIIGQQNKVTQEIATVTANLNYLKVQLNALKPTVFNESEYELYCSQASICPDTINGYLGNDGKCYCNEGYEWNGNLNRCTKVQYTCGANQYLGSNNLCNCIDGYVISNKSNSCIKNDAWCKEEAGNGAKYDSALNDCVCLEGYFWSTGENKCIEQNQIKCGPNALKRDTFGCYCKDGYKWIDYNDPSRGCEPKRSENLKTNISKFSDVTDNYKFEKAVIFVKENKIVNGYADNTYRPNNKINRAEFTKILTIAAFAEQVSSYPKASCFNDVKSSDWFSNYVCFAKGRNIIQGYADNTFKPEININVVEALKITLEAFFNDIPRASGAWYNKYWNYAKDNSFLLNEWNDPATEITRGEMAELIYRIKSTNIQIATPNVPISFSVLKKMKCTPSKKNYCEGGSCEEMEPTVWVIFDPISKSASRCDNAGCDTYEVVSGQSGAFTNIQRPSQGGWDVKIDNTNGDYTETATLGLGSYISSGTCENI